MAKLGTQTMTGGSGTDYDFNVYGASMVFNDFIPGVYVLCQRNGEKDDVLLVGESDNVDRALQTHEKKAELIEKGFNRICFHRAANPKKRKQAADDLIKALKPACN